jgi:hypothetical protein
MELKDFLKAKKVRCVKTHYHSLTVGKEYSVLNIRIGVEVIDDAGSKYYWRANHFEPVLDGDLPKSAEKPLQDMKLTPEFETEVAEPKFAAGEKVYFSSNPDIKIVSDVNNDNTVRFFGEFGWADSNHCCPATQENYEKLCSLFECIDFEQPPTQADIDNEAVDTLAQAMKAKLAEKREQGYHGWKTCKHGDLVQLLINHVDKGDPIDVANFCAFLFARGEQLTQGGTR